MKKLLWIFIIISFLNFFSCKPIERIGNQIIPQNPKDSILEITAEFNSDVDFLSGEIVYFRFYKNGFIEFDDYPDESKDNERIILKTEKKLFQTKIGDFEFKQLETILSSKEFSNLDNKYKKIVSSCDAIPKVQIKAQVKVIEISWCDNLTNPHTSPKFPKIISELFQRINSLKIKYLNKQVHIL